MGGATTVTLVASCFCGTWRARGRGEGRTCVLRRAGWRAGERAGSPHARSGAGRKSGAERGRLRGPGLHRKEAIPLSTATWGSRAGFVRREEGEAPLPHPVPANPPQQPSGPTSTARGLPSGAARALSGGLCPAQSGPLDFSLGARFPVLHSLFLYFFFLIFLFCETRSHVAQAGRKLDREVEEEEEDDDLELLVFMPPPLIINFGITDLPTPPWRGGGFLFPALTTSVSCVSVYLPAPWVSTLSQISF